MQDIKRHTISVYIVSEGVKSTSMEYGSAEYLYILNSYFMGENINRLI